MKDSIYTADIKSIHYCCRLFTFCQGFLYPIKVEAWVQNNQELGVWWNYTAHTQWVCVFKLRVGVCILTLSDIMCVCFFTLLGTHNPRRGISRRMLMYQQTRLV